MNKNTIIKYSLSKSFLVVIFEKNVYFIDPFNLNIFYQHNDDNIINNIEIFIDHLIVFYLNIAVDPIIIQFPFKSVDQFLIEDI